MVACGIVLAFLLVCKTGADELEPYTSSAQLPLHVANSPITDEQFNNVGQRMYYNDQIQNNFYKQQQNQPVGCQNSAVPLKVLNILLGLLTREHFKDDKVMNLLTLLKAYLTVQPNNLENIELLNKLIDVQKNIQNEPRYPKKGNFETKIVFKYELPPLQPECRKAYMKLIDIAHQAHLDLANQPICQNNENIFNNPAYSNEKYPGSFIYQQYPFNNKDYISNIYNMGKPIWPGNDIYSKKYSTDNNNKNVLNILENYKKVINSNVFEKYFQLNNYKNPQYSSTKENYIPYGLNDVIPNTTGPVFDGLNQNVFSLDIEHSYPNFIPGNNVNPPLNILVNGGKYEDILDLNKPKIGPANINYEQLDIYGNQKFPNVANKLPKELYYKLLYPKIIQNSFPNNPIDKNISPNNALNQNIFANKLYDVYQKNNFNPSDTTSQQILDEINISLPNHSEQYIGNNMMPSTDLPTNYFLDKNALYPDSLNKIDLGEINNQNKYAGQFNTEINKNIYEIYSDRLNKIPSQIEISNSQIPNVNNPFVSNPKRNEYFYGENQKKPYQVYSNVLEQYPIVPGEAPSGLNSIGTSYLNNVPPLNQFGNSNQNFDNLNPKFQYVNGNNANISPISNNIPDLNQQLSVANLIKLDPSPHNTGVIELTYMLKQPESLQYKPVYFVKCRLPYEKFVKSFNRKPSLRTDPIDITKELINVSNITEVSANLKNYSKDDIIKLTSKEGNLVAAKVIKNDGGKLDHQLSIIQHLNSDIPPEEIESLHKNENAKYVDIQQISDDSLTTGLNNTTTVKENILEQNNFGTQLNPVPFGYNHVFTQTNSFGNLINPVNTLPLINKVRYGQMYSRASPLLGGRYSWSKTLLPYALTRPYL